MYKNSIISLLFLLCLESIFSNTYNISGLILDANTKEVLPNVNIFIKNTEIGTTTNHLGHFTLTIQNTTSNKKIILNIKMIGYDEQFIEVNYSESLINLGKILLNNKPIELQPLTIHSTNKKTQQIR